MASSERFGYEWDLYAQMDPRYIDQFANWVAPLQPKDFQGKDILDAGCGMGRNSVSALSWGARSVVAFDFDERSVSRARENLSKQENAQVLFQSIYEITWEQQFDIVFCIGVLHHLRDPELALLRLFRAVRPGGKLILWVYSFEGNEWIVRFVNPLRKHITSRLPLSLVHALTHLATVPLWCLLRVYRGKNLYLRQLQTFRYRHVHSIAFDQLIPEVANYWKQDELLHLLDTLQARHVEVRRPPNEMGWAVEVQK